MTITGTPNQVNFGIPCGICHGELLLCDSTAVFIHGCRLNTNFSCEDEGSMYKDHTRIMEELG
jgi:hypothetical protein